MYTREEIKILPLFMRRIVTKEYGLYVPEHVCIYKNGDVSNMIIYLRGPHCTYIPASIYERYVRTLSEAYGLKDIRVMVYQGNLGNKSRFDFIVGANSTTYGELKLIS